MRRLDRAEQARAKDDFKERHYDETIGEALHDLAAGHNMLAAQIPALLEKDHAAQDPALRPTQDSLTASRDVVQSMADTPEGFDPEVAEILDILGDTPAATQPEERDQAVAQETAFNLVVAHVGRAWAETRRLLRTPEGQKMKWDAASAAVIYGAAWASPLAATAALPVIGSIFLYRNEKIILEFLSKHPMGDMPADLIKRHNAAFRKLGEKLKSKD
ncbi:MAG: hypothetical protein ACWA40_05825 [Planktomarina sp.]